MLMEFDEQEQRGEEEAEEMEEDEEEEMELPLPAAIYDKLGSSSRTKMTSSGFEPPASAAGIVVHQPTRTKPRYRECLKNHAVGLGGHAVDGCGEFMAAGADGTLDSLKCAACHCHRNFHRKETAEAPTLGTGELFFHSQPPHTHHRHHQLPQFPPYCRTPAGYLHVAAPQQRPLALPSTTSRGGQWREEQEDVSNPSGGGGGTGAFGGLGSGGGGGSSSTKRLRTKFTQEQKERMLGLAETLGWRIQKHDEAVVQQFCSETGVKRHVLKVWMHNNKHTLGKKPQD